MRVASKKVSEESTTDPAICGGELRTAFKHRVVIDYPALKSGPAFLFYDGSNQTVPAPWEIGQPHAKHYAAYQERRTAKGKKDKSIADITEAAP